MNQYIRIRPILLFIIICLSSSCVPDPPKLDCNFEIHKLEDQIKTLFKADSVRIESIVFKEEIYFPTLIAPKVSIYNPETRTLNFKLLNEHEYERFENYQEIEDNLKVEAEPIATLISNTCDMKKFNDILIRFAKTDSRDKYNYGFISHFENLTH